MLTELYGRASLSAHKPCCPQMEEEGVPSTTLREVSLLQMLSESNHIVKCALAVLVASLLYSC